MKILLLSSKPFLPTLDGGNSATKALVSQLLAEKNEVQILTFSSEKHTFDPKLYRTEPWKQLKVDHCEIELKPNISKAIRALFSGKSYNVSRFSSKLWLQKIQSILNKFKAELVLFDSLYSAQQIEEIRQLSPKSCFAYRAHNIEYLLWEQKASTEKNFLKRIYFKKLSSTLKIRELEIISKMNLILFISADDQAQLSSLEIKVPGEIFPFFPEKSQKKWTNKPHLFQHFGAMNWQPNIDSYDALTQNLFPIIQKSIPDARLSVAGSFMEKLEKIKNDNIFHVGFVENKVDFLCENGVLLAPIACGSGVRIKLMEAIALGVPIVTTKQGAKGLPDSLLDGLAVCNSNQEFYEKAIELATDNDKRTELSQRALKLYTIWKNHYILNHIFNKYV